MINNTCPDYLSDFLPPLVSTTNPYHRRRPYERIIDFFRTELTLSFLPVNIQQSSSLSDFKRYLTKNHTKVPGYYYSGKRMEQTFHCRLPLEMNNFSSIFSSGVSLKTSHAACGHPLKTAEHFFLFCPDYHNIPIDTMMQIEDNSLDIQTLLFANKSLGTHQNEYTFKNLQEFIRRTRRFQCLTNS